MNGVMSNGRPPVARSMVGSVFSVNCTKQLGHQARTWPVLDCDRRLMELLATRDEPSVSPARHCCTPQQLAGPPRTRYLIASASMMSRHSRAMCGVLSTLHPV